MHRTLSGWEYYILLKEAQTLISNRLSKVYETDRSQFRLDFDKFSLMVGVGDYFYVTKTPPPGPQTPTSFAMLMRKHIGSKFLDSFKQYKNDRIYVMEFSNGYKLVLEQFAKGNIFLLNQDDVIIRPYSFAPSSKKTYKVGDTYQYPQSQNPNLLQNMSDWKKLCADNQGKTIISVLGRLSFGKIYTRNILQKLKIESQTPISKLPLESAQLIIAQISSMQKNPQYLILAKDDRFELSLTLLEGFSISEKFSTFSQAVQSFEKLDSKDNLTPEESPSFIRLKKRLEDQKLALQKADEKIEKLLLDISYLEKNMSLIDHKLMLCRSSGEKKLNIEP